MALRQTSGILIAAALALACRAPEERARAHSAAAPPGGPPDSAVAAIRALVERIDREVPSYRRLTRRLTGQSTEGAVLDAYGVEGVARGGVRKLVATYYGETGRAVQTFYYSDFSGDSLVFATEVHERYDRPLSGNVVAREEEQFYFARGQLLRWRDPEGRALDPSIADARARAAELQRASRELLPCGLGLSAPGCPASS